VIISFSRRALLRGVSEVCVYGFGLGEFNGNRIKRHSFIKAFKFPSKF